jgi:hypothetical protein
MFRFLDQVLKWKNTSMQNRPSAQSYFHGYLQAAICQYLFNKVTQIISQESPYLQPVIRSFLFFPLSRLIPEDMIFRKE